MPQVDPDLFDRGQFQAELALKAIPIAAFKKAIRHAREVLDGRFRAGRDIRRLIEDRAWFVDNILQQAWEQFDWSEEADIALLAVGGYGRGELHPYSDIDLLILLDSDDHEIFREPIERFLTLLWDIGLEVGQSVRSVNECAQEGRADLTVITNLMESRTIAGPERLRQRMLEVTSPSQMWPSKDFFLAKRAEQKTRHHKYNDTEYNLEPNVKGSPGGLRDIQTILWVARRQYGTLNLHALAGEGFLLESENNLLASSQEFLRGGQQVVFAFQQKAFACQCMQVQGAVLATGNPQNGLDIAQATGRTLDVGFQVVFGVVVLVVPGFLLGALGQEEVLAWPHLAGAGDFQHALAQALRACDGPAFHQVGDHRQISAAFLGAFVDRTHALTDFQADVPQQGQKTLDGLAKDLMIITVEQDQQIDIGVRVQLATAIAADRQQGDIGFFAPVELFPRLLQDVIDEPGPVLDEAADITASPKTPVEHFTGMTDSFLERGDRDRFQGQFGLELAAVEQIWIHLRHRTAFLLSN